jgi:hypothetical protein
MDQDNDQFLVCPKDNKITSYSNCLNCPNIIQVLDMEGTIRVECEFNFDQYFTFCQKADAMENL